MELKRLATIVVVVLGVVFVVRGAFSALTWYGCSERSGYSVVATITHLGAPPSTTDCALLALSRPTPTTQDLSWPPDEPDPMATWPYPTSTGPDYGKVSCAEGGCEVSGPCPNNVPPVSHFTCTGEP